MDTSNLYIGEVFVQEYSGKEIIEKRIGYRALIYIKEYGSYLTLAHHHEIYPKASQMPIGFKYLKEDVIPYSSFGPITCNNEEIIKALKEKIQELVNERWEKQNNIEDRKKIKFLSWYEYYDLCVIYYNHHGNLKIPERFKTINGYEYDEAGVRLGTFISKQRGNYQKNKLTEEQINLLKKIDMIFKLSKKEKYERNVKDDVWDEKYNLAKSYYLTHGNLNIAGNYRTNDGIRFNENGICLGAWLQRQRRLYKAGKLSQDKIKLLEKLNMKFTTRNDDNNKTLCSTNISKETLLKVQKELLKKLYSLLNQYDALPSREELNKEYIRKLNK